MNLSEAAFLLFLAVIVPLFALVSRGQPRRGVGFLVAASAFFYATWNPVYLIPLALTATTDYWVGRGLAHTESKGKRRALVGVSLTVALSLLATFKYYDALAALFSRATGAPLPGFRLLLATGVSFFTLQSLSYVLDVYRKIQAPTTSFWTYAAFVSFFPTLLAGPITRAETLLPQLAAEPRPMAPDLASRGFLLIAIGFAKKAIADYLGTQLASRVFEQPLFFSSLEILAGVYAYAAQIYCDFSGYSDIAIGAALVLGFRLKANFKSPYRSVTLAEFWQRWHISFSTWLRDYVFFSLPGNRRGRLAPYLNVIVTFVVGGIWHGASFGFLIWGLIHGLGLALERRFIPSGPRRSAAPVRRRALGTLFTFHVVLVAWVFFRADSLATIGLIARRLLDLTTGAGNVPFLVLLLIVLVLAAQWLPERSFERVHAAFERVPAVAQAALLAALALAVRLAGGSSIAPFIYQGF